MVAGFRRSLSLSGASPSNSPTCANGRDQEKSYHVRSVSLPCRSHPIISQVEDGITALQSWQSETDSGSLCAGLALIEQLHTSLDDLLQLPQSQESLRRRSPWTDRLLENFLLLADAHATFRSAIMILKQHQSAAQAAIRRSDEASLISCAKSQRRTEKELAKLASTLRKVSRPSSSTSQLFTSDVGEAELAGILREAVLVTISASASIFMGISVAASSATSTMMTSCTTSSKNSWIVGSLKRLSSSPKKKVVRDQEEKMNALQCLEELEESLGDLETRSERVFRTVMNTRVALLNVLTL